LVDTPDIASRPVAGGIAAGAARFLSRLAAPDAPRIWPDRVAVVVAHPDDETIGAGGQLPRFVDVTVVHVTDGATRHQPGRTAHAKLRRRELETAMAMAGIPARACIGLGIADQEAALRLASIAERLAALLLERKIDIVLTHPYEGGHPDHDATAFALHAAQSLISQHGEAAPAIVEMAFYHAGSSGFLAQQFVSAPGAQAIAVPLSTAAWALKQRMLSAYASQTNVVVQFSALVERFRQAPRHDFRRPPNGGAVYYDRFDWGMTSTRWCQLAADAMRELHWSRP
jgi:N-acetylglucosamine malate deacetylase 2